MTEYIDKFYKNITEIYLDTSRRHQDKSIAFRTEFEQFIKNYVDHNANLNELLKDFYKIHRNRTINDIAHELKNKLNAITHGEYQPNEKDVKIFFEMLVRITYIATKVEPNKLIQSLLNINQDELLNKLNDKQKQAVLEDNRIVYVNAGPGTGKTHILVNKIFYHIKKSPNIENIVALSYTNSSADELGIKISEKIYYSENKGYNLFSGTIHSFALSMLREYAKSINSNEYEFSILDEEEIEFFAEEICLILGAKYSINEISSLLNGNNTNISFSKELFERVDLIKKKYKFISFDDILIQFQKAIHSSPEFISWLSNKISLLLVDEAQDLTKLEYDILEQLIEKTNSKLFLVGDPRQNIFGFNGGSYEHLEAFLEKNQVSISRVNLDTSYRCPNEIFKVVNEFSFSDFANSRINSSIEKGGVNLIEYEHKFDEAKGIVKIVKEINDYKHTAILFTSLKYLDTIADLLNETGIPFVSVGGKKYLKKYIRFIVQILRVIKENEDHYSWKYLAKQFYINIDYNLEQIDLEIIKNKLQTDPEAAKLVDLIFDGEIRSKATEDVLLILWDKLKLLIFQKNSTYQNIEIENDISELIQISKSFRSIEEFLIAFALNKELFKKFYKKDLEIESNIKESNDAVTLSTIHSAKGLEWKNVIIPGLSDGLFPNPYFCEVPNNPVKTQNNYNDELKKLYVAMTRTLETLTLTYPLGYDNKYGRTFPVHKSRFLNKIGL